MIKIATGRLFGQISSDRGSWTYYTLYNDLTIHAGSSTLIQLYRVPFDKWFFYCEDMEIFDKEKYIELKLKHA